MHGSILGMSKFISPSELHKVAFAFSIIGIVGSIALCAVQAYVRWKINQNFTFLGGVELEALTVASFALLIALVVSAKNRE